MHYEFMFMNAISQEVAKNTLEKKRKALKKINIVIRTYYIMKKFFFCNSFSF